MSRRTIRELRQQQQSEQREREQWGPCCGCGVEMWSYRDGGRGPAGPVTIMMLPFRSPEPGSGCWGCLQCGLDMAGAVAMICEACAAAAYAAADGIEVVRSIVLGEPKDGRRMSLDQVERIPFDHDRSRHPELLEAAISDSENDGESRPK